MLAGVSTHCEALLTSRLVVAGKLDRIYSLKPCYGSVKIVASVTKSDHDAVIAYDGEQRTSTNKKKEKLTFEKRSTALHAVFLSQLSGLKIKLAGSDDTQANFDQLYSVLMRLLERFYPTRSIIITSSDPPFHRM